MSINLDGLRAKIQSAHARIDSLVAGGALTGADKQSFTCNSGTATQMTAAWPIPANDAHVGTLYRLKSFGVGTYASGTSQWWRCNVFGSGQAQATFTSLPGTFMWDCETEVLIVTTGGSGTAFVKMRVGLSAASVGATPGLIYGMTGGVGGTTVTVDTTTPTTMFVECAIQVTCTIKSLGSSFERIGT
jgi:hypothetical protein